MLNLLHQNLLFIEYIPIPFPINHTDPNPSHQAFLIPPFIIIIIPFIQELIQFLLDLFNPKYHQAKIH